MTQRVLLALLVGLLAAANARADEAKPVHPAVQALGGGLVHMLRSQPQHADCTPYHHPNHWDMVWVGGFPAFRDQLHGYCGYRQPAARYYPLPLSWQ